MTWLRKAWNHRQTKEERKTIKSRAIRGFVWLLLFMLACTLLSRTADSLTLAMVKTEIPRMSALSESAIFSGVLQADGDVPVLGYPGMLVREVLISPGDNVKKGDPLLRLDLQPLEEQIAELEHSLSARQEELSALLDSESQSSRERRTNRRHIQEDYDQALREADRAILLAQEDLEMARQALEEFRFSGFAESSQLRAYENDVMLRERALEQAEADKQAVDLQYKHLLEDAKAGSAESAAPALMQMEIEKISENIQTLKDALQNEAVVSAPLNGVVTELFVRVGQHTGYEALLLLNDGQNLCFVGEITKKQLEIVPVGASLMLRLPGQDGVLSLKVASVELSPDAADRYRVVAPLPAGEGRPGQSGEAEVQKSFGYQPQCVSPAALHQEGTQEYVLEVVEKRSVLGVQYIVQRVNVTVIARNETVAAIAFDPSDTSAGLITESSKPVADGDRVRLGG